MNKLEDLFIRAIDRNQLSHAYLFEGAKGVGKSAMAIEIAKLLNCTNRENGEPACLQCEHCLRIEHGNFPDVIIVEPEGATIKVDQIRTLRTTLSKTAMESSSIVCVIHAVDTLTQGAANSLLKFLEEPTGNIHFILLTEQLSKVLATIQSRCQIIRFSASSSEGVVSSLLEKGVSQSTAQLLSQLTSSPDQATTLLESETFGAVRQESWNWFARVFTNRSMAFVTIQSQVMPLLASKADSEQFLSLLQIYIRDALLCAQGLEEAVIQKDKLATLKNIVKHLSVTQWIKEHEQMTEAITKVNANVGVQAVLEQWVLQIPK